MKATPTPFVFAFVRYFFHRTMHAYVCVHAKKRGNSVCMVHVYVYV